MVSLRDDLNYYTVKLYEPNCRGRRPRRPAYARKRELGAASRCNVYRGHRWFIIKMIGIKFVPTSEWQVLHRTEECAERTWDRVSGAPLVPLALEVFEC